jgi:predicted 2-oxoglutarate/Fe(II)-dependent dioxygenase YbiX
MIAIIENFYTKEECDSLRNHPDNEWITASARGIDGKVTTGGYRNADITYRLPIKRKEVVEAFKTFNKQHYNLHLNGHIEAAINRYGVGQYFKLHYDMILDDTLYDKKRECRKISAAIQLSDPSEYEGGRLIVKGYSAPVEQGTMILFHSLSSHEVTTITKGMRYSQNIFAYGKFEL